MKIFRLFLLVSVLFLNGTIGWSKIVPYSSYNFFYNVMPGGPNQGVYHYSGLWSNPMVGDPCGIVYRDYMFDETISVITTSLRATSSSSLGTTIGSSSALPNIYINVRTRSGRLQKSTLPGNGCPPMAETEMMNNVYYMNAPLAYYGFEVYIGGLRYYGWMRVENGSYFAYIEDIPGFSVKVGDMVGFQTYPSSFTKLTGTVYRDNNADGAYNTGDTPVPYQRVSLEATIYSTSTNSDGSYTMMVPGNLLSGSKNVALSLTDRDVYIIPANGKLAVSFPQYSEVTNLNFGVNYNLTTASQPQVKVSVEQVTWHRRCFKSRTKIIVENKSSVVLTDVPVLLEIPA
ncbi:MAG: hypothetical protein JWM14_110 [Chitinophagaceae bacterium]|nr:hypothetical protein [Chitinophagaceae bacterium]